MDTTLLEKKLKELLLLPAETEWVEFKEAKTGKDFNEIGKYFSALSNEANIKEKKCAWLVFGIKDNHEIVGSNFRSNRKDLDNLKAEIANHTTANHTFTEIYELQTPLGRVILFQIPPAPKGIPIAWKGFFYARDGESRVALSIHEIEQMRNQAKDYDWSAQICEDATIDDLDSKAIDKARINYKEKYQSKTEEIDTWDTATFLNKAKITIKGKVTRSAILLLGKEESEHFINPSVAKITWILKDERNNEIDYEHFSCPFLLTSEQVYFTKIRNLKYRYLKNDTLFPTEITKYEPYVIREALHNCIAHQDYELKGRINIIEFADELVFSNVGSFIPQKVENVIQQDAPQETYRNPFLAQAMVNLNMIDTVGGGIKKMFNYQRNRFFPLPDYDLSDPYKVTVRIYGKVLDENYTRLLIAKTDLDLRTVILLDRVQKRQSLSINDAKLLRLMNLIEGRNPNLFVSAQIASLTGDKTTYIKNRAFDDDHYKQMILNYLEKFGSATRNDFEKLILDKLSDVLTLPQKKDKVKNLLQDMRRYNKIRLDGRKWYLF
jgi:ATP-dependent DNA helicase RecG